MMHLNSRYRFRLCFFHLKHFCNFDIDYFSFRVGVVNWEEREDWVKQETRYRSMSRTISLILLKAIIIEAFAITSTGFNVIYIKQY